MDISLKQRFYGLLSSHKLRRSVARETVFTILLKANTLLSLQEIAKRAPSVDRASIYRICQTFQAIQLIESVTKGSTPYFELAAPFKPHHHHITCRQCNTVISLHSPTLEKLIERIAMQKGFQLQSHTLELQGLCRLCQVASPQKLD